MKITTEELHKRINNMKAGLRSDYESNREEKDTFEAGHFAGALSALSDLKIELLEWELQERLKAQ